MVTKQQQLKWLASSWSMWHHSASKLFMSRIIMGCFVSMIDDSHQITLEEWQQERDKMQKKAERVAQPAPDNSWHERGEFPPVGVSVELWVGGSFAYNCEFITRRGHHYVMWNLDADRPDAADYMNSEFRPRRTEREKAIDEMANLIAKSVFGSEKCQAEKLYDAGYRRVASK